MTWVTPTQKAIGLAMAAHEERQETQLSCLASDLAALYVVQRWRHLRKGFGKPLRIKWVSLADDDWLRASRLRRAAQGGDLLAWSELETMKRTRLMEVV